MNNEIIMIPIERIRVLNPRPRDKKKFEQIIQSIKNLGLKKPIQVSLRSAEEGTEPGYDLVCGQGRMEAFLALGHKEIPAIVVEVSREERLLRSLVENMARRLPSRLALMNEIERLKADGYSNVEIGKKLDMADNTVHRFKEGRRRTAAGRGHQREDPVGRRDGHSQGEQPGTTAGAAQGVREQGTEPVRHSHRKAADRPAALCRKRA